MIYNEESGEKLEVLASGKWDLPTQIDELQDWLKGKGKDLSAGKYVADVGFDIRKNASGGGAVIESEAMKIMGEIGMDIFLSEYPGTLRE